MTLTEYKNQKNPVRFPNVILRPGEYRTGMTTKLGDETFTQVWIDGFPSEYCLKGGKSHLYTTDSDGNPQSISCFTIEENEESNSK